MVPATQSASTRAPVWMLLLIAAVGVAAYHNSFSGPFIFDDTHAILGNPSIRRLWPLTYAFRAPPTSAVAGRPLVNLSFMLDYSIGGLHVRGYHVVNLLIHLFCGLTLFGLVRRTLCTHFLAERFARSSSQIALAIAMIWIVHPLTTDTITYISNRSEAIAGLFILLAVYCLSRAANSSRRIFWQVCVIVSTLAGVMSKEIAVVTPILLLLYDRTFLAGSFKSAARTRPIMYLAVFASWIVTIFLLTQVNLTSKAGVSEKILPWHYLLTQSGVIVMYLQKCLWPTTLSIDYDGWPIVTSLKAVWPQATIMLSLLIATVWAIVRRSPVGFLGAWFFFILGPTSSVLPIPTEIAAERRMYLPLMAVIAAVVFGAIAIARRFSAPAVEANGRPNRGLAIVLVCVVAALSMATMLRNATYSTARSIWEDVLANWPNSPRAHTNLGIELLKENDVAGAIEHHRVAIFQRPGFFEAHNNLGMALAEEGHFPEAIEEFRLTDRLAPNLPDVLSNLAAALAQSGRLDESIQTFERALTIDPNYSKAKELLPLVIKAKQTRDARKSATTNSSSK